MSYQNMKQIIYNSGFVYHMESLYRDNANDKYELCSRKNTISQNTKYINS
jgi:hypothetical protein